MTRYRAAKKYWKMVLVLLCICGALLLIRWAAMIGPEQMKGIGRHTLGILLMVIIVLEAVHYLLTASWLPWR